MIRRPLGYRPSWESDERPPGEEPVVLAEPQARPWVPYTNGLAIASLVLGIVALIGPAIALMIPLLILIIPTPLTLFTAVPGVILGHLALGEIQTSRGRITGSGLAVAGLVTGYVAVVLMGLAIVYCEFILPVQQQKREETLAQRGLPRTAIHVLRLRGT